MTHPIERASVEQAEAKAEAGRFSTWDTGMLARQCHAQARENLDPEYTSFMHAVGDRLQSCLNPSPDQTDREAAAYIARLLTGAAVEHILEGFKDDTGIVQAVAKHRQQARDAGFAEGVACGQKEAYVAGCLSRNNDVDSYSHMLPEEASALFEKWHAALSAEANEGRCDG